MICFQKDVGKPYYIIFDKPKLEHFFVAITPHYNFFKILPGNYNHDEFAEMHLQPDPLFSIPSDNIYLTCMTGTHLGRIFLGGKDGCVYEIVYQVM